MLTSPAASAALGSLVLILGSFSGCVLSRHLRVAPIREPDNQHARYLELVDRVKRRITSQFSSLSEQVSGEVTSTLEVLENSSNEYFYAVACLVNAARYLDEINWMPTLAQRFVYRSSEAVITLQYLDLVHRDPHVGSIMGSRDEQWNTFVNLVAVLEWNGYPGDLRRKLQSLYARLLNIRETFSCIMAAGRYAEILRHLIPRPSRLPLNYAIFREWIDELERTIAVA